MKKGALFIVFLVFLSGYFLRVMFLPQKALTFGYDQARDAIISQQIFRGDIKIQGPPASTPGLYHGVFYYYLLAPAYLIGHGDPIAAAYWIAFLNALTVFIVFYLTYLLTRGQFAACLASLLYAFSFEATQYATWLSNPTIGVWTVPLLYLGLWIWISQKGRALGPILAAIGLGLSIQAEIFLLYHAVPLSIWLWLARKTVKKNQIVIFVLMLLVTLSSMIVSEIKFGLRSVSGILSLMGTGDAIAASKGLGDFILLFFNQLGRVYAFNSYPGNVGYGGVFVLLLIIISLVQWGRSSVKVVDTRPFLATWLFAHVTVTTVGGTATPFLLVGIGPAVSILLGVVLASWWARGRRLLFLVVLALLIFGNVSKILKENPAGSTIFAIQKDMLLSKQLLAIDYTYEKASGEAFSINSLTSPLWVNIVWSYLYKWYGLPKYGYLPTWHGRGQEGILDSLIRDDGTTGKYFLILEPMGGIPLRYLEETISQEDSYSTLLEEKSWGELRVQSRVKNDSQATNRQRTS